ncbi:MAG: GNAT family acetyltransferase [Dehalococcoidia bacterium]|nr:GNAT family acetyltransferase [Dehalococcoidia bacterium]
MEIRPYRAEDEDAVIQLWRDCRLVVPHNDPHKDIRRKQAMQADLLLVGIEDGRLVATLMAGYEGHRGWLNYLAVAPDRQRCGFGRQMVAEAEIRLRRMGCPKINLQVRRGNAGVVEFYRKLGYLEDDVVSMGKRLEKD